ncbi:MAG: imidazole glycerol phosphate synthase subunit HisH [Solirubrobacteraceae bacterium]
MKAKGGLRPPSPAEGGGRGARVGVVDYGMGNRRSVEKALEHVGASVVVSSDVALLGACDGLVVPGVGAFPKAMENLAALGLDELIVERVGAGVPVLGICLGLQVAFERSSELGGAAGLGIVPGEVRQLNPGGLKLPHIGWSEVHWLRDSPLLGGVGQDVAYYHVHSYACEPHEPADMLGTAEYGRRFVTAVARGSFIGVQFHPEKSSLDGLRLLANFASICVAAT